MRSLKTFFGVLAVFLALLIFAPAAISATLVPAGSVWSYLDNGSDAGSAWRDPAYDDSAWASGPAELGYGDGLEATVVATGTGGVRAITTYFRHSFAVVGASEIPVLKLQLLRDDGAVVYLNGVEVHRSNLPAGVINSTTLASAAVGGDGETSFEEAWIDAGLLVEGPNIAKTQIIEEIRKKSSSLLTPPPH